MTIHLPLDRGPSSGGSGSGQSAGAALPPFISPTDNVQAGLARTIQAIVKAKRIVVICG